jgi:hypothetical protein
MKEMMMSQRNLVLGSVASLALVGGMLAAAPGYGQALPRYPTPDEQAQTQALNAEQASTPATTTTVAANPADPGSSAVIAQNSAAQAQYNAQLKDYRDRADARLKDYQDKTSAYQKQKQDYDTLLDRYEQEHSGAAALIVTPPAAEVVVAPPEDDLVETAPATVIAHDRLVNFDDLRDPERELAGVPVEDRAGYLVGHFRHLTYQDNSEEAVITLHNNKTVVLDDEHLRFDPVNDVVVADLTFNELNSMPARF